jgi:hypothetical protein
LCFIVHKTTSKLEYVILTTLYFTGVENTKSWRVRKGDLKRTFPLDVPMVHSSVLAVSIDGEYLACGGFPSVKPFALGALSSSPTT